MNRPPYIAANNNSNNDDGDGDGDDDDDDDEDNDDDTYRNIFGRILLGRC